MKKSKKLVEKVLYEQHLKSSNIMNPEYVNIRLDYERFNELERFPKDFVILTSCRLGILDLKNCDIFSLGP